jgi:hypothetical protein
MIKQSLSTRLLSPLLLLAMLLATANLYADSVISTSLTGMAEVPSVNTMATGLVNISVAPDRSITGSIDISGMVPTMAHIHEAAVGVTGPQIMTLIKTGDSVFTVPANATLSEAQYARYLVGNLYVNVHSLTYPNGEIRAQLPGNPTRIAN